MSTLPTEFMSLIAAFAPLFSSKVFRSAQVLLTGAILAVGKRTVSAVLRVMGVDGGKDFSTYHQVLNRDAWAPLKASRIVLSLLVRTLVPTGPLIFGLDDTIERRWGAKIAARGIYRDPVRSSDSHFVKASGLRWLCMMLLAPVPWAGRIWALPFLTALCPSERYHEKIGQRHKMLTDWARQLVKQVSRWLPGRDLVVVADSSFAALAFLAAVAPHAAVITRLRLDAALYAPAPLRLPGQKGRPRRKGERLPTLAKILDDPATAWSTVTVAHWYGQQERPVQIVSGTAVWYGRAKPVVPIRWVLVRDPLAKFDAQAFLCTDQHINPSQLLDWFVRRWQIEVTFEEARRHLGLETQRQWSDKAIARTTPCLLGLYSIVTLAAHRLRDAATSTPHASAWYAKPLPTFSDAIAWVRRDLWAAQYFSASHNDTDKIEIPRHLWHLLTDTLCYAT